MPLLLFKMSVNERVEKSDILMMLTVFSGMVINATGSNCASNEFENEKKWHFPYFTRFSWQVDDAHLHTLQLFKAAVKLFVPGEFTGCSILGWSILGRLMKCSYIAALGFVKLICPTRVNRLFNPWQADELQLRCSFRLCQHCLYRSVNMLFNPCQERQRSFVRLQEL